MNVTFTILGLILGIVGIYLTRLYSSNFKITYIKHNWFSPLDTLTKKIADIDISYKNQPISQNIFLLSMSFINAGNNDIDQLIIHNPLTVVLPNTYKFINSNVISNSSNLNIEANCINNKLQLKWDLFKTNEYFRFYSLIEYVGDDINLAQGKTPEIKFEHRISNLKEIKAHEITFRQNKLPTFFIVFILIWGSISILNSSKELLNRSDEVTVKYLFNNKGSVLQTDIILNKDNTISIVDNGKEILKTNKKQFSKYNFTPIIVEKPKSFLNYMPTIFILFISALFMILAIYILYKYYAEKNLLKNKEI